MSETTITNARSSGLEDELVLLAGLPRLISVKSPSPDRDPAAGGHAGADHKREARPGLLRAQPDRQD